MICTSSGVTLDRRQVDSVYLSANPQDDPRIDPDRFIVSLIVGYQPRRDNIVSPEQAVAAAVALVGKGGALLGHNYTMWHVFDRQTGKSQFITQGEVAHLTEEMS